MKPAGSPYDFFWANVIRKPCPDCSRPTAVGFDRNDPGVYDREPTKCLECSAEAIHQGIQDEAAHPDIKLKRQREYAQQQKDLEAGQ